MIFGNPAIFISAAKQNLAEPCSKVMVYVSENMFVIKYIFELKNLTLK